MGYIPPSPEHIGDLLRSKLVKEKLLEPKYAKIADEFYHIMKMVTHREIKEVTGEQFDNYFREAEDFVNRMQKFIEEKEKGKK